MNLTCREVPDDSPACRAAWQAAFDLLMERRRRRVAADHGTAEERENQKTGDGAPRRVE